MRKSSFAVVACLALLFPSHGKADDATSPRNPLAALQADLFRSRQELAGQLERLNSQAETAPINAQPAPATAPLSAAMERLPAWYREYFSSAVSPLGAMPTLASPTLRGASLDMGAGLQMTRPARQSPRGR